jgi:hypothetical protein
MLKYFMIIAGKAIQFWALIVWFISTCLHCSCRRHYQGFYPPVAIPNWFFWLVFILQYVCHAIFFIYVQWFTPIIVYVIGFILASVGISDRLGNIVVRRMFKPTDSPPWLK